MSDDLRNRVARAIAKHHTIPWENMPEARKKRLLAYADAALAEIGGARVKPLVWKKSLGGEHLRSHCEKDGNAYSIIPEVNRLVVRYGPSLIKVCGECSDAKAAAQADYEARILAAIDPAPVSVREAARVLLDECKDGEVWPMYVNAMMPVLNADLSADSWNTVDEIRAAFAAALRAIAEGKE